MMSKSGLVSRSASGAPILYGYWASIIGLFLSGLCLDKIEVIDRLTSGTGHLAVWWPTDWPWAAAALLFGFTGTFSLNAYGRACWATEPRDTWNSLPRNQIRTQPLIRRPRWLLWKH